ALAELSVLDHLHAVEVHGLAHSASLAADHAEELVECARPRRVEHVVEERGAAVREELLRPSEPLRAAGGEDEAGHGRAHGPCSRSSQPSSTETLIVRQRAQRIRTFFVICIACIDTASTFPQVTQT